MTADAKDTVLVVDDERAVRETLGEALEAAGLRVLLARGGESSEIELASPPFRAAGESLDFWLALSLSLPCCCSER